MSADDPVRWHLPCPDEIRSVSGSRASTKRMQSPGTLWGGCHGSRRNGLCCGGKAPRLRSGRRPQGAAIPHSMRRSCRMFASHDSRLRAPCFLGRIAWIHRRQHGDRPRCYQAFESPARAALHSPPIRAPSTCLPTAHRSFRSGPGKYGSGARAHATAGWVSEYPSVPPAVIQPRPLPFRWVEPLGMAATGRLREMGVLPAGRVQILQPVALQTPPPSVGGGQSGLGKRLQHLPVAQPVDVVHDDDPVATAFHHRRPDAWQLRQVLADSPVSLGVPRWGKGEVPLHLPGALYA